MALSIIHTSMKFPSTLLFWLWLPMPMCMLLVHYWFHHECWEVHHRSSNILFFHGLANILVIFLKSIVCFGSGKMWSNCLPVDEMFKSINTRIVGAITPITYFIILVIAIDAIHFSTTELLVSRETLDPIECSYVYNLSLAYSIIVSVVILLLILVVLIAFVVGIIWTDLLISTNYIGENSVLMVRWFQREDDVDEEDGRRMVRFLSVENLPLSSPTLRKVESEPILF